jgi:hypothetical protein
LYFSNWDVGIFAIEQSPPKSDPSSQNKHFNLGTSQRVISESFYSPAARMPLVKVYQYLPSLWARNFDALKVDTGKFLYEVREGFL